MTGAGHSSPAGMIQLLVLGDARMAQALVITSPPWASRAS